jgi:succinate dehydrogenase cytochrome b subunit
MNGHSGAFDYFWLHRLHSITGILVSAAYLLCFLVPYAAISKGAATFDTLMGAASVLPMLGWSELLFVALPLIFHAAMGVLLLQSSGANVFAYGFYRNWMYLLQRIAGIIVVPFLLYHIFVTKLALTFSGRHVDEALLHQLFARPWVKAFYCVGVVCAAFYIGNGLGFAAKGWGIAAARRARSAITILGWIVTLLFAGWGLRIVFAF